MPPEIHRVSEIELADVMREDAPPDNYSLQKTVENAIVEPQDTAMVSEHLANDEICIAIKDDEVPDMVLKAVLYGLAEEQASLKNLRESKGNSKDEDGKAKDTSHISLKRGTLLKFMSETLLQRQALVGITSDLDLRGPKFREVFKMLLGIINQTFDEIKIPQEYKEMFFHALSRNLEGWEDRAERLIKAMTPRT